MPPKSPLSLIKCKSDKSKEGAFYVHIVTVDPITGNKYDIEILTVVDFSDDAPATESNLCSGCAGIGKCSICHGTGQK